MAAHIFEAFADGLRIPAQARRALGIASANGLAALWGAETRFQDADVRFLVLG